MSGRPREIGSLILLQRFTVRPFLIFLQRYSVFLDILAEEQCQAFLDILAEVQCQTFLDILAEVQCQAFLHIFAEIQCQVVLRVAVLCRTKRLSVCRLNRVNRYRGLLSSIAVLYILVSYSVSSRPK